jgi:hypothetical protein
MYLKNGGCKMKKITFMIITLSIFSFLLTTQVIAGHPTMTSTSMREDVKEMNQDISQHFTNLEEDYMSLLIAYLNDKERVYQDTVNEHFNHKKAESIDQVIQYKEEVKQVIVDRYNPYKTPILTYLFHLRVNQDVNQVSKPFINELNAYQIK